MEMVLLQCWSASRRRGLRPLPPPPTWLPVGEVVREVPNQRVGERFGEFPNDRLRRPPEA